MFYAGHGVEARGENFLVPVDARLTQEGTVGLEALRLTEVMGVVGSARELGLVILDACRDNPLAARMARTDGQRSAFRGLQEVEPSGNVLVAYAAKAGSRAADGRGRNSPFTTALLEVLNQPGRDVRLLFGAVRERVLGLTERQQEPWIYGALGGSDVLLGQAAAVAPGNSPSVLAPVTPPADPAALELAFWQSTESVGTTAAYQAYLSRYPGGQFAALAQLKVAPPPAPAPTVSAAVAAPASAGGRFQMRAEGLFDAEQGVIWAPSDNGSNVNWNDARRYCAGKGAGWSLPTSAQLKSFYDPSGTHARKVSFLTIKPATPSLGLTGWSYWSSEASGSAEAFFVRLADGSRGAFTVSSSLSGRALCVRRP